MILWRCAVVQLPKGKRKVLLETLSNQKVFKRFAFYSARKNTANRPTAMQKVVE
jgi:hypothetical protein